MHKSELLVVLLAMAAMSAFGQDQAQDPPSRVARLNYMSGTVSFRPGTVDEWTAATINYPLYNGDHLWADRDARTELHVGSTALRMGPETALAVLESRRPHGATQPHRRHSPCALALSRRRRVL